MSASACFEDPPPPSGDEDDTESEEETTDESSEDESTEETTDESTEETTDDTTEESTEDTTEEDTTEETDTGPVENILVDLYEVACEDAEWSTSPDGINPVAAPCDADNGNMGAVIKHEFLEIETGDEVAKALLVRAWNANEGLTQGIYLVDLSGASNPVLRAGLACPADAMGCDVGWQIWAHPLGAPNWPQFVENGFQSFDGATANFELDLSDVAGEAEVELSVIALANGNASSEDDLILVRPRIVDEP